MTSIRFGYTRLFIPTTNSPNEALLGAKNFVTQNWVGLAVPGRYFNVADFAYGVSGETDTLVASSLMKAIDKNEKNQHPGVANALKNLLGTYLGQAHHFGSPDTNLPLFPHPGEQPSPFSGLVAMDPWPFKLTSPPVSPSKAKIIS